MSDGAANAAPAAPETSGGSAPEANNANAATDANNANGAGAKVETPSMAEMLDLQANGEKTVVVTVDGEEVRVPLKEAIANFSRAKASHKRFEEAAKLRKETESREARLRDLLLAAKTPDGLGELAKRLGMSKRQILEAWAPELAADEMMTPQERKMREAHGQLSEREKKLADLDKQIREREEQMRQKHIDQQAKVEEKRYLAEFEGALKAAKLPTTPAMIARMAKMTAEAMEAGVETDVGYIAEMVREEFVSSTRALTSEMGAEHLAELLGKEKLDAVRKLELEKAIVAQRAPAPAPTTKPEAPKAPKSLDQLRDERERDRERRAREG